MGLEKDDGPIKKAPPKFSGKAINLRFPDLVTKDENTKKKIVHKIQFITFPSWVHQVHLGDKIYKVLGEDLQVGMPIVLNGQLFPIIDISSQYYHGIIYPHEHPMGTIEDITNLSRYSFKRVLKQDEDYWVIKEKVESEFTISNFSRGELDNKSPEDLKQIILFLQKESLALLEKYEKASEGLKVLTTS